MAVWKKYSITGAGIVLCLVAAVSLARALGREPGGILKTAGAVQKTGVQLIIYSDFQCPACHAVRKPVEDLKNQFPNDLQVEFRHYPLERVHRWALTAALFAECAAEQGKFWQYHDRLFEEQARWSGSAEAQTLFSKYAADLSLDLKRLGECLQSQSTLDRVKKDAASGRARQVRSTPTIFINERVFVGAKQLEEGGRTAVIEELKKLGKHP